MYPLLREHGKEHLAILFSSGAPDNAFSGVSSPLLGTKALLWRVSGAILPRFMLPRAARACLCAIKRLACPSSSGRSAKNVRSEFAMEEIS